jgi:hypothetical protein
MANLTTPKGFARAVRAMREAGATEDTIAEFAVRLGRLPPADDDGEGDSEQVAAVRKALRGAGVDEATISGVLAGSGLVKKATDKLPSYDPKTGLPLNAREAAEGKDEALRFAGHIQLSHQ